MQRKANIIIADDDSAIRTVIARALVQEGYKVDTVSTAAMLWQKAMRGEGDAIVTDVVLPDGDGIDILSRIHRHRPEVPVIVISGESTLQTAVRATDEGAFEYIPKPFDLNDIIDAVNRAMEIEEIEVSEMPVSKKEKSPKLIGRSKAMQDVYRTIARVARTNLSVLITGESGTGKELVAQSLHEYGPRVENPFIAVNMAAIPHDLIESELFGHTKGAFTGATSSSQGRFSQAQHGTLFLDEIGDMPLNAQTRLLRVLQEGEFRPIGAANTVKTDVRIVAATHRNLNDLVRQGLFREDLLYRLNVIPLHIPPLRDRPEDIKELTHHFLEQAGHDGLPVKIINEDALELLTRYHWPGNVRELENMVRRIAALHPDPIINTHTVQEAFGQKMGEMINDARGNQPLSQIKENLSEAVDRILSGWFDAHGNQPMTPGLYGRVLREIEKPLLRLTLEYTKGNQSEASEILGINRNTLRKKLKELDLNAKGQ
ncbi:MAG: nitrogen regulation protein NR(I) [Alphaproteobacteria bacterium]